MHKKITAPAINCTSSSGQNKKRACYRVHRVWYCHKHMLWHKRDSIPRGTAGVTTFSKVRYILIGRVFQIPRLTLIFMCYAHLHSLSSKTDVIFHYHQRCGRKLNRPKGWWCLDRDSTIIQIPFEKIQLYSKFGHFCF